MSKQLKTIITLCDADFLECQFFYSFQKEGKKETRRFTLTFRIGPLSDSVNVQNDILAAFFVDQVLNYILPFQPLSVSYDRLKFRVASDTGELRQSAKHELLMQRGRGLMPNEDPTHLYGKYSCRFSKRGETGSLTLRISEFVSAPRRDYFMNSLAQNVFTLNVDSQKIPFRFCGLTLNRTVDEIYDFYDEIIEKIT